MTSSAFLTRNRHGALAAAFLALALVLAQSAAIAHGYSHLRTPGEQLSAPVAGSSVCLDCLSFAPLLAAAGGASPALEGATPVTSAYRTLTAPLSGVSPRHAFLSRAPPAPV